MKLADPSPPPELAARYAQLVTLPAGAVPGTQAARTRRAARLPATPAEQRRALAELRHIAEEVARRLRLVPDSLTWRDFVYAESRRLLDGIFDSRYWLPCPLIERSWHASTPTSIADTAPAPYSYRVGTNLPTKPTYGTAVPDAGPARYAGALSAGYYADTLLCWQRDVFELTPADSVSSAITIIWRLDTNQTMHASTRGSRPLASLMLAGRISADDDGSFGAAVPPLRGARSLYWRYKLPTSAAPYYTASESRLSVVPHRPKSTDYTDADATRAVLASWPRALLGHGNNNNTACSSSIDQHADCMQINPALTTLPLPVIISPTTGALALWDNAHAAIIESSIHDSSEHCAVGGFLLRPIDTYGIKQSYHLDSARLTHTRVVSIPTVPYGLVNQQISSTGSALFLAGTTEVQYIEKSGLMTLAGNWLESRQSPVPYADIRPWQGAVPCGGPGRYIIANLWEQGAEIVGSFDISMGYYGDVKTSAGNWFLDRDSGAGARVFFTPFGAAVPRLTHTCTASGASLAQGRAGGVIIFDRRPDGGTDVYTATPGGVVEYAASSIHWLRSPYGASLYAS